jgi:hypothetical protein
MELFTSLEKHFQQLNADLIGSSKESERDMFDQRNQQFQTILLASSVMFSALSTVIIQVLHMAIRQYDNTTVHHINLHSHNSRSLVRS